MIVVEMNPRVSRSSALASKATGFPIAKIAAKLAVGYTLDELPNDITRETPASFEPTIDYCVTKIPRWTFEKFPEADETLTTQMKSVGEAMSIGRTFKESLQKGIRSMEVKRYGLGLDTSDKWHNSKCAADGHEIDTEWPVEESKLHRKLSVPCQGRLYYVRYAFKLGWSIDRVFELTQIDRWFLAQMKQLVDFESELAGASEMIATHMGTARLKQLEVEHAETGDDMESLYAHDERAKCLCKEIAESVVSIPEEIKDRCMAEVESGNNPVDELVRRAKQWGYSDVQLATIWRTTPDAVREFRKGLGIEPVYKLVDTCAAEFEAYTPYYYSTYETPIKQLPIDGKEKGSDPFYVDDEVRVTDKKKIVILGGGPNRIGQGIEFDYCCVHAAFAARELGYEAVMVNSNPETVSTDYDTSDMLFFEPLTLEDVLNICEKLNGKPLGTEGHLHGVIVQFGGQTPLNLARGLEAAGVPIIGTSPESIDLAEDRERFAEILEELALQCPEAGTAYTVAEAREVARRVGYPVLVRPSYVLGGRAMEIVSDQEQLDVYMAKAVDASTVGHDHPILVDKFLSQAIEVDVDCISDFGPGPGGQASPEPRAVICGVMEHIEEAGIHSGDSACALPPHSLTKAVIKEIERQAKLLAERLKVRGLMNIQFAVKDSRVYLIEVNPRASRTVPFVSKATGVPWAKLAARVMAGQTLAELGVTEAPRPAHTAVKESVFPFTKFPGVDVILGPEMRSTGEVMGIDMSFHLAFAKSQMAAGTTLPVSGTIFISVCEADKAGVIPLGQQLAAMGFNLMATNGTHRVLTRAGVRVERLCKLSEGRPNIADLIVNSQVDLLINTPTRRGPTTDEGKIRALATIHQIPLITTMTAANAAAGGIAALRAGADENTPPAQAWTVRPLQEYFPEQQ